MQSKNSLGLIIPYTDRKFDFIDLKEALISLGEIKKVQDAYLRYVDEKDLMDAFTELNLAFRTN